MITKEELEKKYQKDIDTFKNKVEAEKLEKLKLQKQMEEDREFKKQKLNNLKAQVDTVLAFVDANKDNETLKNKVLDEHMPLFKEYKKLSDELKTHEEYSVNGKECSKEEYEKAKKEVIEKTSNFLQDILNNSYVKKTLQEEIEDIKEALTKDKFIEDFLVVFALRLNSLFNYERIFEKFSVVLR